MIKTNKFWKNNFSFACYESVYSNGGCATLVAYYTFYFETAENVQSNWLYFKKRRQTILMQNYLRLLLRTTIT